MKRICQGSVILIVVLLVAALALAQTGKVEEQKTPVTEGTAATGTKAAEGQAQEATPASEPQTKEAPQTPAAATAETPPAQTQPTGEAPQKTFTGKVVDAATKAPIANAPVTIGNRQVHTDQDGNFSISGEGDLLRLRAAGYARRDVPLAEVGPGAELALEPLKVKALYLTVYGTVSKKIRTAALEALERNNMNALVLDVKGDRGFIPFKVDLPLAEEVGAQKTILSKDYPALLKKLKDKGLYLIARIVVFKDDPLASAKPQWAVKKKGGAVFRDREKLRWTDGFIKEVWDYNIAIAKIAAELGFDEVQFDYVRFPDTRGVVFSKPSNVKTRTEAITGFLKAAYEALIPYNVFVSADVFGYVPWNENDTDIGQQIVPIMNAVDIVSLMVYPSGYHLGIPKYRNPVKHPYEIVYLTHKRALERTKVSPLRFRPWLQAFRDYAFRGGDFTEARMRTQIKAADDFGASGWMFWNPRNLYPTGVWYTGNGKKKPKAASKPTPAQAQEGTEEGDKASQGGEAKKGTE